VPWLGTWSQYGLAALALTVLYGAYVAEVYRAGVESIHWSQTAAARSLGLSQAKTMRFVVLPQAVRRVVPPLMNDFIGLQKDTAFIGITGAHARRGEVRAVAFLELRGVEKRFGDNQVLKGIDLDVEEHELVSLIGASGCGKSTLLRCVNPSSRSRRARSASPKRPSPAPASTSTSTSTAATSASCSRASTCSRT
jgi:ABC-type multidrug transport system fused ATPase/permease subunit